MGRILDIRVLAHTYNEDQVVETWPHLCSLVWPDWVNSKGLEGIGLKTGFISTAPGPVEKILGERKHGVIELAVALADGLKFCNWGADIESAMHGPLQKVLAAENGLARALADWNTQQALQYTDKLEESLDAAESALAALF